MIHYKYVTNMLQICYKYVDLRSNRSSGIRPSQNTAPYLTIYSTLFGLARSLLAAAIAIALAIANGSCSSHGLGQCYCSQAECLYSLYPSH